MDITSTKYSETSTFFSSQADATLESQNGSSKTTSMKNPFLDSFSDPFCKLSLKETSDFVKTFPVPNNGTEARGFSEILAQNGVPKRNLLLEAPPTPGRPIFSFSNTNIYSRKCFPSKWDDAEKWLVSGNSCNDSPSNNSNSVSLFKSLESSKMYTKQCSGYKPHMGEVFAEKSRITEEKVSKLISNFQMDHHHSPPARAINGVALSASADVLLKDKFPNEFNFGNTEPMQEKFLFGNNVQKSISHHSTSQIMLQQQQQIEVQHRDIGTEMTPLGSSTTSRCPTPFKSTSPARHNTPADRSGPLGLTGPDGDISHLQDCHLAKLHSGTQFDSVTTNWSSREEEEEDVSKSLRHFEISGEFRKSVSESRNNNNNININTNCVWEEEEKTKSCHRYQREEAKIQAWVNLQSAKAEAESRKLEVKIQKMRANLEEKLMKRMADVHRKAEEWRATAQFQHSEQIRKADQLAREAINNRRNNKNSHFSSGHKSCFPCNK